VGPPQGLRPGDERERVGRGEILLVGGPGKVEALIAMELLKERHLRIDPGVEEREESGVVVRREGKAGGAIVAQRIVQVREEPEAAGADDAAEFINEAGLLAEVMERILAVHGVERLVGEGEPRLGIDAEAGGGRRDEASGEIDIREVAIGQDHVHFGKVAAHEEVRVADAAADLQHPRPG